MLTFILEFPCADIKKHRHVGFSDSNSGDFRDKLRRTCDPCARNKSERRFFNTESARYPTRDWLLRAAVEFRLQSRVEADNYASIELCSLERIWSYLSDLTCLTKVKKHFDLMDFPAL